MKKLWLLVFAILFALALPFVSVSNQVAGSSNIFAATKTSGHPTDYTLTPDASTVLVRKSLSISWTAPSGSSTTDWIGFYKVGNPNSPAIWYQYTGGATSGSLTMTTPNQPGQYEFRYFLQNTYNLVATSSAITVTYGDFTLTPSAGSFNGCGQISISWTAPDNRYASDWIALAKVGSADTSNFGWFYTNGAQNGSLTFKVPVSGSGEYEPGTYEFRYFLEGGYTKVKTSDSVGLADAPYSVTASYSPADGKVHITYTAPSGRSTHQDWIGVYYPSLLDMNYLSWFYSASPCGSTNLTLASGTYEFRYFVDNGYTRMATSNIVTVP